MESNYCIRKHIDNIVLNDYEYLLESENGEVKLFDSESDAVKFLNENSGVNNSVSDWDNEGIFIINIKQ